MVSTEVSRGNRKHILLCSINVAPVGRVWSAVQQARVSNVTHLMVKVCPEYLFSNSTNGIAWPRAVKNSSESNTLDPSEVNN